MIAQIEIFQDNFNKLVRLQKTISLPKLLINDVIQHKLLKKGVKKEHTQFALLFTAEILLLRLLEIVVLAQMANSKEPIAIHIHP